MTDQSRPYLQLEGSGERFDLSKAELAVGRAPDNDVRIDEPEVSRFHAQFTRQGDVIWLSDLGSSNGTFVNDTPVHGTVELRDDDNLRFGGVAARFHDIRPEAGAGTLVPGASLDLSEAIGSKQTVLDLEVPDAVLVGPDDVLINLVRGETVIGRVAGNDLVLPDPFVSRQHAKIQRRDGDFIVSDLDSSNGTFVDGELLTGPKPLEEGDEVRFGHSPYQFHRMSRVPERGSFAAVPRPVAVASTGGATIELANLMKHYQAGDSAIPVLQGISLTIRRGDFVSVVGPSGSGKSTLINMITGIDQPDSGKLVIHGQDIGRLSEDQLARWRGLTIGLIFQFFQLLPTLSAIENVMLPMDFCKTYPSGRRRSRARDCLALVGMDQFADRLPSALSGGQQQRVAIARALANDPPIIIGDEPTGNLDSATAQQVFNLLRKLAEEGKTVVLVTHDPLLARSTSRKVEILDGRLVDEDRPNDAALPTSMGAV